jgi:hypothetical protein
MTGEEEVQRVIMKEPIRTIMIKDSLRLEVSMEILDLEQVVLQVVGETTIISKLKPIKEQQEPGAKEEQRQELKKRPKLPGEVNETNIKM